MKDKHFDVTLKVMTPTFIGSGVKLNNKEYYVDENNNCIHEISENELFKVIKENRLINKFEKFMINKDSLNNFLKYNNIKFNDKLSDKKHEFDDMFNFKMNDVHTFIRDGFDNIYIPGSSLKGAIRTALIYKKTREFKNKKELFDAFVSRNENKFLSSLFNSVDHKIYFSKIAISDGYSNDLSTGIYGKSDFSTLKNARNSLPIYRECVKDGTFIHKLTIYENNYGLDFDYILEALDEFVEYQMTIFDKFNTDYEIGYANLVFGGGTGFFNKNVHYALNDKDIEVVKVIKNNLNMKFKHNIYDKKISPRTMKFAGKTDDLFGLCELTGVEI